MIVGNNHEISCYGEGRDGWMSFLEEKICASEYSDKRYEANYGTGMYVDVTTGLFAYDFADLLKTFVKEDGTYGTGVCRDYNGNWMLRRCLWTDMDLLKNAFSSKIRQLFFIFEPYLKEKLYICTANSNDMDMMTTVTTAPVASDSRYSRIQNAREYARRMGRKPLTPEQRKEFNKMVAEFTNL